eukprot:8601638-Pyramimonas_sp.AAC.1
MRIDGGPPHVRSGADAWDLLRGDDRQSPWTDHLRNLDPGSLLVLTAGLPGASLSAASQHGGLDGLAGSQA